MLYRIYGDYTDEDIVRIIFRRTHEHYLENLKEMTFKVKEHIS